MAKSRAPRGVFGERVTPRTPDRSIFTPPVFGGQWERKNTRAGSWQGFDNPPPDDTVSVTSVPVVNVAPVIDAVPDVTPAVWSSGATDTERWEMAASSAGPWSTVSDMPARTTPYTSQTFGKVLRWYEAQGGVEAVSEATAAVAEALTGAQSSGANIVTNGDFASSLTGWTTFGTPTTVEVTGGRLHIITDATNEGVRRTVASAAGTFYQMSIDTQVDTDGLEFVGAVIGSLSSLANTGTWNMVGIKRATNTSGFATIRGRTASSNIYADNAAIVPLTLNGQLTAPSADMDMAVLYPLPGSPRVGEQVQLLCRISDFATGNYWTAVLEYTGSAWNAVLYSVAANTLTACITAAGVGATNGIRAALNGNDWELFTTADGGDNWTSRGTFTSTLYNTATGVNAMWTDQFAPETLIPNP